jgi:hypothetical protein
VQKVQMLQQIISAAWVAGWIRLPRMAFDAVVGCPGGSLL